MIVDDSRLTVGEFEKVKIAETIETRGEKSCRPLHSPLWQADADKIRRMAPIEFIGRYMPGWFDYAICDEIHQLAGDTAQGNALGTLASCTDRIVGLTGTLLGRLCRRSVQHSLPSRSQKDEGTWLRMGHDGTQFLHSGLRRSRNHHQGRTRQQRLLQGENHEHGPAQARSLTAAVWRIPDAVVRLCVPRGHLRGTSAVRGNLSERADGRSHAGSVPRTRRGDAEGVESSPGQPVGA